MQIDLIQDACRQIEVCNACRYCEGYCAVFPSLHANRAFSDGDITQLANLCHNCRGCHYACQYNLHLGAVLGFFLLMPYTKMAHGFYRLAALIRDALRKAPTSPAAK